MNPLERSPQRFTNPLATYFAATRPAFLSVTFAGAVIGLGTASADGLMIDMAKAVLTVLFALIAHAGANVVNDYYDALSGTDVNNHTRLFPFTGGSRFIQNGVLSLRKMRLFGYALLAAVIPAGLWLTAHSAPPLQLMARGVGELAIVCGWMLVVLGTDFVQRGAFGATRCLASATDTHHQSHHSGCQYQRDVDCHRAGNETALTDITCNRLKRFRPWSQLQFMGPGAAMLQVDLPVRLGHLIDGQKTIGSFLIYSSGKRRQQALTLNATINHNMRNMNPQRTELAGHALRHSA
jgi:hypothetical protein